MLSRIMTVAVYVDDQQRSLEFYTQKLGFEVRAKHPMGPGSFWIELAPAGAETCVVIFPRALMDGWAERKPSIMFATADAEATYQELCARGVTFTDPPRRMPWGVFAKFADPDGNDFLITSPPK